VSSLIDVVIADHQELFYIGMAEVLADANDVRIVGRPQSPELLLGNIDEFPACLVEDPTSAAAAQDCTAGTCRG
jgi:hypothetical protein